MLPDPDHAKAAELAGLLKSLPSLLRQSVADALWSSIPKYVYESAWSADASQVTVNAQTADLELITGVFGWVESGLSGYVVLGSNILPVSDGLFVIAPMRMPLLSSDVRQLIIGTPGSPSTSTGLLSLVLTGERLPTYGEMSRG